VTKKAKQTLKDKQPNLREMNLLIRHETPLLAQSSNTLCSSTRGGSCEPKVRNKSRTSTSLPLAVKNVKTLL